LLLKNEKKFSIFEKEKFRACNLVFPFLEHQKAKAKGAHALVQTKEKR